MRPAVPRAYGAAAGLLLLALLLQCLLSMRLMSASYDEHAHLPAGYTYLKTGQLKLNAQHPPLVKLIAGFPLLFLGPKVDWTDESWTGARPSQWRFGARFLYAWGNDADRLLFWGRLPIVLLSLVLGLYVFRWSVERFGPRAGIFGLLLYAFCPNVIAHSRLVTMDVALSTFATLTFYYVWRYVRDGTRRAAILAGISLGLALATKFSALVFVPLALAGLLLRRPPAAAPVTGSKKKRRQVDDAAASPTWVTASGLVAGLAILLVWIAYLVPVDPGFYFKGVALVNQDHNPDHHYYLLGEFKPGRWWYYFLVAFAVKTPIPILIALGVAAVLAWRNRGTTGRDDLLLLVPALVFFAFTSAFADNLGVRYVLPVFPLLFVFVSRIAAAFTTRTAGLAGVALLGAWQVWAALRIYPDYLAYFNEAAGGPAHGYRLLDDSNVDWGQDLKRLGAYLKERNLGPVPLCFDLQGYPPYYGIEGERITIAQLAEERRPPGTYAVATHCLVRVQTLNRPGGPNLDWLQRYEPIGRVGYSFYLFRF
jgi:hypothetical protein